MRSTVLLVLLCALLVTGRRLAEEAGQAEADTHHGPESPRYVVKNITSDFEVREYENATWAVSFGRSRWLTDFAALQAGFGLSKYFTGNNADEKALGVTVPVIGTLVGHPPHPPPHPPHKNGSHPEPPPHPPHPPHPHPPPHPPAVALAAFIPRKFEGEPPLPNDRRVKIVHTNSTTVYTRSFGGWAFSWTVRHQIDELAHALKDAGICPFKGKFFSATYDLSPWKLFGRTNEVWWVALPRHHNGTHNSTEGLPMPLPRPEEGAGLELLDAATLFPEEFPPPPAEGGLEGLPEPRPEEDLELPAAAEAWEVSQGEELTSQLQAKIQELQAAAEAQPAEKPEVLAA